MHFPPWLVSGEMADELKDREPKWNEVDSRDFCVTNGDTSIILIPPENQYRMYQLCLCYNKDQKLGELISGGAQKAHYIGYKVEPSLRMQSCCLAKTEVPGK